MEVLWEIETRAEQVVERAKILPQYQQKVQILSVISFKNWMQTQRVC